MLLLLLFIMTFIVSIKSKSKIKIKGYVMHFGAIRSCGILAFL